MNKIMIPCLAAVAVFIVFSDVSQSSNCRHSGVKVNPAAECEEGWALEKMIFLPFRSYCSAFDILLQLIKNDGYL